MQLSSREPKALRRARLSAALACAGLMAGAAAAAPPAGLSFSHNDWELACDNTRTCRAAGYHADGAETTVSVLLTRGAGPNQPVTGELALGEYGSEDRWKQLPAAFKLAMTVNGRAVGTVGYAAAQGAVALDEAQVAALLAALPQARAVIEWSFGRLRWRLSDSGAAAVLLKMDEFQGRLGTRGALMRKGPADESRVLPPLPVPVLAAAPLTAQRPGDDKLPQKQGEALLRALRVATKADDCEDLHSKEKSPQPLEVTRLAPNSLLVSTTCWTAAYNAGTGYWVVEDRPPFRAVLVTASGTEHDSGTIFSGQKGRGLGDCMSSDAWTWDGRQFVQTQSSSSGMCKLIAPGGAWALPTLVTQVRPAPGK